MVLGVVVGGVALGVILRGGLTGGNLLVLRGIGLLAGVGPVTRRTRLPNRVGVTALVRVKSIRVLLAPFRLRSISVPVKIGWKLLGDLATVLLQRSRVRAGPPALSRIRVSSSPMEAALTVEVAFLARRCLPAPSALRSSLTVVRGCLRRISKVASFRRVPTLLGCRLNIRWQVRVVFLKLFSRRPARVSSIRHLAMPGPSLINRLRGLSIFLMPFNRTLALTSFCRVARPAGLCLSIR